MTNPFNVEKAVQKYQQLAKDALTLGDPVLHENYLQHADHFTRILNEQENYKKQKFAQNKSSENTPETQELSTKSDEINIEDKKIVAEIKPISKKKTEDNLI